MPLRTAVILSRRNGNAASGLWLERSQEPAFAGSYKWLLLVRKGGQIIWRTPLIAMGILIDAIRARL